jgi:hypothetical protein
MAQDITAINITWRGREYTYDPPNDLTVGTLRQIKSWYPELGTYYGFDIAWRRGDPDAIACVMWVLQRKSGENAVEPRRLTDDFGIGEFMNSMVSAAKEICPECHGEGWLAVKEKDADPLESPSASTPQPTSEV